MDNRKWYQKWTALDYLSAVVLVVCLIMTGMYFSHFNGKPSSELKDWGIFGDYFAAVFGLLAFLGVLHTARLSEKRAEKAKKESIERDERDQFFRMLDLFQKNSQEFTIKNDSDTETLKSTLAFEFIKNKINRRIFYELIKIFINELDDTKFKLLLSNGLNTKHKYYNFYTQFIRVIRGTLQGVKKIPDDIFSYENIDINGFKESCLETTLFYKEILTIDKNYYYRVVIDTLYSDTHLILDKTKIFNAINKTTSHIFEQKGTRLDIFCNTFKGILGIVQKFKNYNDNFYSLLQSQLSRDQLVILFIYSFSRFSNKPFVENLLKSKILYELDLADLVIFNSKDYKEKEILWKAIVDLHQFYLED